MVKKSKLPIAKLSTAVDYPANPSKYKPSKEDVARERRYKAEDGLRAIQRAEEVRKDKTLMSDIKSLAKEQVDNLKKFC